MTQISFCILRIRTSSRFIKLSSQNHGEVELTAQETHCFVKLQLISGNFNNPGCKPLITWQAGISFLPVEGYWKIVLPFNADVWVPLVQGLRVLLKHPLVPSGNAVKTRQSKTKNAFLQTRRLNQCSDLKVGLG